MEDMMKLSSAEDDEIFCQPCASDGDWLLAAGFCTNCQEHLCQNCLKTHKKLAVSRKHIVLDEKDMPRTQESFSASDFYTELCRLHHGETIKFYCTKHDQVGCSDCMVLNHKSCKNQFIKDASHTFFSRGGFKRIEQKVEGFKAELQQLKEGFVASTKSIEEVYASLVQQVKSFREEVNKFMDNMEAEFMEEAKKIKIEQNEHLTELKESHEALHKHINDIADQIHSHSDQVNSLFVIAKHAEEEFANIEAKIKKLEATTLPQQCKFNTVEKIRLLSSTVVPPEVNEPTKEASEGNGLIITTELQYVEKIGVKSKRNKTDCDIADCLVIDEVKLVMTDWENKSVKLIYMNDSSRTLCCSLNHSPWSLTAVSSNQIATTIPDEQKIQLISINKSLSRNGSITVNGQCRGISYKEGKFALSYVQPVKIEILNMKGMLLHTLSGPTRNQDIFINPLYIKFGIEQSTIDVYVSDLEGHKITKLNFNGQIISSYTSDMLRNPQGLVITDDGKIIVCSKGKDTIHVLTDNLQTAKVIKNNNIPRPYAISYSGVNNKLFIYSEEDKNHMYVFRMA